MKLAKTFKKTAVAIGNLIRTHRFCFQARHKMLAALEIAWKQKRLLSTF